MSNSKLCVSIDVQFFFGCKFLCVKCQKLAKPMSEMHIVNKATFLVFKL